MTPDQDSSGSNADDLLGQIDRERIPAHIAVIMDGNGRWAKSKGLKERYLGHQAATEAVRDTTRAGAELGLKALTLFAFSTENWSRPRSEVGFLMRLFEKVLVQERDELMRNGIRLTHTGWTDRLPDFVLRELEKSLEMTAGNEGMVLNLALNYGGRAEIVEAARRFAKDVADGQKNPDDLDSEMLNSYLCHPELGDPDLLIRTSGELRISNFLLWQLAYSEIFVTQALWPDFRRGDLYEAIGAYQKRERRFGGIG